MLLTILSWVLLLSGSAFCLIGSIGLLRLPDFFSRVHAAGIVDSLGAILIFLGLIIQSQDILVVVKLFLILLFMMITGPTAVHSSARAALIEQRESSEKDNL